MVAEVGSQAIAWEGIVGDEVGGVFVIAEEAFADELQTEERRAILRGGTVRFFTAVVGLRSERSARRRGKKWKYLAMMTGLSEGLLHSAKIIPSLLPDEWDFEEWEDRCVLSEGRIGRVWSFLR